MPVSAKTPDVLGAVGIDNRGAAGRAPAHYLLAAANHGAARDAAGFHHLRSGENRNAAGEAVIELDAAADRRAQRRAAGRYHCRAARTHGDEPGHEAAAEDFQNPAAFDDVVPETMIWLMAWPMKFVRRSVVRNRRG